MRRDSDADVELGLSLGAQSKSKPCRILTAKDFAGPARAASRASPTDSSSSVSSSSVRPSDPDPDSPHNPSGSGSANPVNQVVGWPPVKSFRTNSLFHLSKPDSSSSKPPANQSSSSTNGRTGESRSGSGSSLFVKVNMDGDPIGRKVDLGSYRSYEGLAICLEVMFNKPTAEGGKGTKLLDNASDFVLTYKDKDGDWLLVGDVPWNMFLDTAKRLRIMRNCDANRLASRYQNDRVGLI